MRMIVGNSFAEVYEKSMDLLFNNYEYVSKPRGLEVHECLNVGLFIEDPSLNLFKYEDKRTDNLGYSRPCRRAWSEESFDVADRRSGRHSEAVTL